MIEAARFLAVALVGLALDIAVAWCAARLLGLPLWLAAAVGFALATASNYAAHELWTFRKGAQRLSVSRALSYGAVVAATLGARVATVAALATLVAEGYVFPVLLAGAGVSFFVNFAMSKCFVFRPGSNTRETAP